MSPQNTEGSIVFYSWQSDLPNSTNWGFIEEALQRAIRKLGRDPETALTAVLDRDTVAVAGSPDISATIFEKIARAGVFVCDVSIVNDEHVKLGARPMPNPNVLIELGYAVRCLGWERVICVCNVAFGGPELLPFDLRGRRVLRYFAPEAPPGEPPSERAIERAALVGKLQDALRSALVVADQARLPTPDERRHALIAGQILHAISLLLALLRPFLGTFVAREKVDTAFDGLNNEAVDVAGASFADVVVEALRVAPLLQPSMATWNDRKPSWIEFLTNEGARFQKEISDIQTRFGAPADAELAEHIERLRIQSHNATMTLGSWQTFPEFYQGGLVREDYQAFVRQFFIQVVSSRALCLRLQERAGAKPR